MFDFLAPFLTTVDTGSLLVIVVLVLIAIAAFVFIVRR